MRSFLRDNSYKSYSLDNTLVHKCTKDVKLLPDNFYMSKIALLNKKPFDGVRAPIALEILKESELVIYFNSLISRFEIYYKNDYYKSKFSGSNIISTFYSNPDYLPLSIVKNILTDYISENKLLPTYSSYALHTRLKNTMEDIFRLGYIYIINKELQDEGHDFTDLRQNNPFFCYDEESTNNECYYAFSKDRLPPLDEILQYHYLKGYVSANNTELNYDVFRNFHEPVKSGTFERETGSLTPEMNRFPTLVIQAFLGIVLHSLYLEIGLREKDRYDY